jgi:large subunit ribosomal protein L17
MRHKNHHASLGVTREHRKSMMSNMAASLIEHDRIETTLAKAKALRPFIEKVITKAKQAGAIPTVEKNGKQVLAPRALHLRRLAGADVRSEDAVTLLFKEKYKQFVNRSGGYTRIYKLGQQRMNDAAEMALIEFVKADDVGYKKAKVKKAKAKKAPKTAAAVEAPAAPATEGEAKA